MEKILAGSKLLFLGDFYYDFDYISEDIVQLSRWIRSRNYSVILNLEGALYAEARIVKRGPCLALSENFIEVLKMLNVVGVTLANNHSMDFGEAGLMGTIARLREAGIQCAGAGRNLQEALTPMVFEIDGREIVVASYGWSVEETEYASLEKAGCAPRDLNVIQRHLHDLRNHHGEKAFIVHCYHWGFEFNLYPMPFDINMAHQSAINGCDLIIGHHPHVIQPYEEHEGTSIYYSLGNFYFASRRAVFAKEFGGLGTLCDIGHAVSCNVITGSTSIVNEVFYDREADFTRIRPVGCSSKALPDIPFSSAAYVRVAREGAYNVNPILTTSMVRNSLKLFLLFARYFLSLNRRNFKQWFGGLLKR